MFDPKFLDDLAAKFSAALPSSVHELKADAEKTFRATLQSAFAKLDLVTREEFEVQSQVLARTRAKLDDLEAKVRDLEAKVSQ
jgi:BMFP domain-containing protein YqiC